MSLPDSAAVFGSSGDLILRGGEGWGVIVVAGTLRLKVGTYFSGFALVGGDLVVENGATIQGMARVRGRLRLLNGGSVLGVSVLSRTRPQGCSGAAPPGSASCRLTGSPDVTCRAGTFCPLSFK